MVSFLCMYKVILGSGWLLQLGTPVKYGEDKNKRERRKLSGKLEQGRTRVDLARELSAKKKKTVRPCIPSVWAEVMTWSATAPGIKYIGSVPMFFVVDAYCGACPMGLCVNPQSAEPFAQKFTHAKQQPENSLFQIKTRTNIASCATKINDFSIPTKRGKRVRQFCYVSCIYICQIKNIPHQKSESQLSPRTPYTAIRIKRKNWLRNATRSPGENTLAPKKKNNINLATCHIGKRN